MAIQCKYCGTDLPKDDAHFCNKCGMLVPSHPFSPQSLSASKRDSKIPGPSSSNEQQERQKRVLHEQVAELSPARSKPDYVELDAPVKKLDAREQKPVEPEKLQSNQSSQSQGSTGVEELPLEKLPETPQPEPEEDASSLIEEAHEKLPPVAPSRQSRMSGRMPRSAQVSASTPEWPAPVTHVSAKESSAPAKKRLHEISSSASSIDEIASAREFRENKRKAEEVSEQADAGETPVEDVPTQEVSMPVEDVPTQEVSVPVEDVPTQEVSVPVKNQSRVQEQAVERVASNNPFLAVPSTQEAAQEQFVEDWRTRRSRVASSESVDPSLATAFQSPASPSSQGYQSASMPDSFSQDRRDATFPVRRPRRRWPIVIVVLVLVVLVVGGLGGAMLLSQQPNNNSVIQAQVSFSDAQLGISLLYPNGWIKQVDTGKSTAQFYASNHVGEVDIIVAASSGNVKQALQQQATKMGLSGKKAGATLNFAGVSWQQLQGTLNVSGANYTDTILATTHGNQFFMMVQQAPQNNYADWEKEFFAPLRASFKFL